MEIEHHLQAIVDDPNLSKEEKIKQLNEMLLDENLKATAEEENMRPDTDAHSDKDIRPDIIVCLRALGAEPPINYD